MSVDTFLWTRLRLKFSLNIGRASEFLQKVAVNSLVDPLVMLEMSEVRRIYHLQ